MRVRYMLAALRQLAAAVEAAAEASGLGWWEQTVWNSAAIDGFIFELQLAHAGSCRARSATASRGPRSRRPRRTDWSPRRRAVRAVSRRMSIYSFRRGQRRRRGARRDEIEMAPGREARRPGMGHLSALQAPRGYQRTRVHPRDGQGLNTRRPAEAAPGPARALIARAGHANRALPATGPGRAGCGAVR